MYVSISVWQMPLKLSHEDWKVLSLHLLLWSWSSISNVLEGGWSWIERSTWEKQLELAHRWKKRVNVRYAWNNAKHQATITQSILQSNTFRLGSMAPLRVNKGVAVLLFCLTSVVFITLRVSLNGGITSGQKLNGVADGGQEHSLLSGQRLTIERDTKVSIKGLFRIKIRLLVNQSALKHDPIPVLYWLK